MLGVVLGGLVLAACGSPATDLTADPDAVIRQAADWPAQAAPLAGAVALREQCSSGVGPVVATEDRGFGIAFALMGTPERSGNCELRAIGLSWARLGGGGSLGFDPVPDDAFRVEVYGHGPAWTPERASAVPQIEWRYLIGLAPVGMAEVRAAIGGHAVEATMGGRLFVVAWPNDTKASLLIALDADGNEIARLDAAALTLPEFPGSLGPPQ